MGEGKAQYQTYQRETMFEDRHAAMIAWRNQTTKQISAFLHTPISGLCCPMKHTEPLRDQPFDLSGDPDLSGTVFEFTPVPMTRRRGWCPLTQRRFIMALSVMGSVRAACDAVGMGRVSAYRLRERDGAESFADAWDRAVYEGRTMQFSMAMDRAMNGVTTVRVHRGGSVSLEHGPELRLVRAALNPCPAPPVPNQARR